MKLPAGARDIEEGVALLAKRYTKILQFVLSEIDELAKSGLADARWCAIARTDVEKGFMSLNQALPSARDGRNYGKVPHPDNPSPPEFTPPVDPEGSKVIGAPLKIEWRDVGA